MSAAQLLEQARTLGIVLSTSGGGLRYEAPAGRLTPELRRALIAHKAAILDLLEGERLGARRIVQFRDCAVELEALVHRVADFHGFSTQDRREALEIAMADPLNALDCFRALLAEIEALRAPNEWAGHTDELLQPR